MPGFDFLIDKADLRTCRFAPADPPDADALADGQVLLRIEKFALTANNITYAVMGEAMSYWNFFPADEGWGKLPVWGFGEVAETRNAEIETGARYYGYFPASSHLTVQADAKRPGFIDVSGHRRSLPGAYNQYSLTSSDPAYDPGHENEQMIMRPLFLTSFLLADFLLDNELFGAGTAILSSASSKTAYSLAFVLSVAEQRPRIVGLTSPGNVEFTESLGVYDEVVSYGEVESISGDGEVVYADMSGNAEVRADVHRRFGDDLAHSAAVGVTHWEEQQGGGDLPGPDPVFFFAPTHLTKRAEDWGPEGVQQRFAEAWNRFVEPLGDWMEVSEETGEDAVRRVYLELLEGGTDPRRGHVLSLA